MKRTLEWQIATVTNIKQETRRAKTFTLRLPDWVPHHAGQHYDLRLTAPDGYQAQRSYSVASEPERSGEVDLTIERIDDGEVSPYMHDIIVVGDKVEMRGPIGGYFVWDSTLGGPLLLVAGGSGIVPLMAMARHRAAAGSKVPARLLISSRAREDAIYFDELQMLNSKKDGFEVFHTFTRVTPPNWNGYARRIDREMIAQVARPLGRAPLVFVCGPTAMVESAANALVQIGIPPNRIKTERFGPTGN